MDAASFDSSRATKEAVLENTIKMAGIADKSEAVLIGDTKFDLMGAEYVGIDAVAVEYGYGTYEELREHKTVYIAKTVEDLRAFFLVNNQILRGIFMGIAKVKSVIENSIAYDAYIEPGDVITMIDGICDFIDFKYLTSNDYYVVTVEKKTARLKKSKFTTTISSRSVLNLKISLSTSRESAETSAFSALWISFRPICAQLCTLKTTT
ncbi:MAG: HAD hydrolase-like protein [Clostridiales bacterium]|nr:MAG: HAD hydrolase-like protein [Clostridiales bacterium]